MILDGKKKLEKLDALYRLHETLVPTEGLACREGCATCCTRNVTVTSLEGAFLLTGLDDETRSETLRRAAENAVNPRLVPLVTVNSMAALCMEGKDFPEEAYDPSWTPCPLLSQGRCTVYPFRPFACRAMVSKNTCGASGEADMDDFLFTVNNVFMQVLEHLDQEGSFSNVTDMLNFLGENGNLEIFSSQGKTDEPPASFLKNLPMTLLMVPPEHRERMKPVLDALQDL
jgi:Fe-S-cluster containining protein